MATQGSAVFRDRQPQVVKSIVSAVTSKGCD